MKCKHKKLLGPCKYYKRKCTLPCKFAEVKDKLKQGVDVTKGVN